VAARWARGGWCNASWAKGRYLNGKRGPLYLGGTVPPDSTRTPEATMPEPARRSVILASPSAGQPGEVDRLNAILEKAGLGSPLGPPKLSTPAALGPPVSATPR